MRATKSVTPPAEAGTIKRTGRDGYVCVDAGAHASTISVAIAQQPLFTVLI
jgi:hypothetical protein